MVKAKFTKIRIWIDQVYKHGNRDRAEAMSQQFFDQRLGNNYGAFFVETGYS